MAGAKSYQVVAPLVIAKQEDGSDLYLYFGVPVPDSISSEETERLAEGGFIALISTK